MKPHERTFITTPAGKSLNKQVSWNDAEYLEKVHLQEPRLFTNPGVCLEGKASVGPCFRPGMPCEGPSGIMLFLPAKPSKITMSEEAKPLNSGICLTISKKNSSRSKIKINPSPTVEELRSIHKNAKEKASSMLNIIKDLFKF